jgi:glutaredoxin 3
MNHVVIWSKPDCPYCTRAKSALRSKNIPFEEKVLNQDFTREILLETYPTAKTFPVIVVDGYYIGGYTQLEQRLTEEFNDTRRLLNETENL